MQMNYKSALMQHKIIDFNQSVFMQGLIIVFSQSFVTVANPKTTRIDKIFSADWM